MRVLAPPDLSVTCDRLPTVTGWLPTLVRPRTGPRTLAAMELALVPFCTGLLRITF